MRAPRRPAFTPMHNGGRLLKSLHKAARAGAVVVGHTLIAAVLIVCAGGVERLILLVNDGHDPLVYGRLPLSYLFQTIDIAMIGVFGFYGLVEAIRIMRGEE